ncbi:hypothetical protein QBC44DRAFT_236762 [Cladorrhinum sp. PSN332]|nr:hypothetical protein QBC44DRAFT_236762 [Cladorrhinum sp. PSN332]
MPSDSGYGGTTSVQGSRFHAELPPLPSASNSETASDDGSNLQHTDQSPDANVAKSDEDDQMTVYSDASVFSTRTSEGYISAFVNDIFNRLGNDVSDPQVIERLSSHLPRLIKGLALKIGFQAPSQMHREVMVFLHKHRAEIAESFKRIRDDIQEEEDGSEPDARGLNDRDAPPPDILGWLHDLDPTHQNEPGPAHMSENSDQETHHFQVKDADEEPEPDLPRLEEYRSFLFDDAGYHWLIDQLRRELHLCRPDHDLMEEIREKILGAMPTATHISTKVSSQTHRVVFEVDWDPLEFFEQQECEEANHLALPKAITLTGSDSDIQALSCSEYLTQTWPRSGKHTVELLQRLLGPGQEKDVKGSPMDGLTVCATMARSKLVVEALGVADFIADIGEQLAWLGAALRSAPLSAPKVVYCIPYVDVTQPSPGPPTDIHKRDEDQVIHCSLKFRFEDYETALPTQQYGDCWHAMFNYPVIVRGFPILKRSPACTGAGLEMPLNMITALAGTNCIDRFGLNTFIKGFSAMVVATEKHDDLVIWHYFYNENGGRISYLDHKITLGPTVTFSELESCRHVVGWCADSVSIAGSKTAQYNIKDTGLPVPGAEHRLDKFEISGGQFVTGTAVFAIANREKPAHINRSRFYEDKLQFISEERVVFWDEESKRGWLVNGASALLHLLRDSLEFTKSKFPSTFALDPTSLGSGDTPLDQKAHDAALRVLENTEFRNLPLFATGQGGTSQSNTKETYLLEHRVEFLCNILEKMIDHQADYERRDGLSIVSRLPTKRFLHGWEFRDIARSRGPLLPRVCELDIAGKGWVDLIKGIRAVTIFGRGFGALIQLPPAGTSTWGPSTTATAPLASPSATLCINSPASTTTARPQCPAWAEVPTGKYYLAARIMDLRQILDHGDQTFSSPVKLCNDLLWYVKSGTFSPCPCTNTNSRRHCDPVQTLFRPSRLSKLPEPELSVTVQPLGAVIFGHTSTNPIRYLLPGFGNQGESAGSEDPSVSGANRRSLSSTSATQNTTLGISSGTNNTQATSLSSTTATSASHGVPSSTSAPSTVSAVQSNPPKATGATGQHPGKRDRFKNLIRRFRP